MIEILIALLGLTALAIWGSQNDWTFFSDILSPIFAVIGFIGLIVYSALGYSYFAAEYKANIINREYKTNYSQIEVFYASDVIDTIRELDRKRIELNGNIMTGK